MYVGMHVGGHMSTWNVVVRKEGWVSGGAGGGAVWVEARTVSLVNGDGLRWDKGGEAEYVAGRGTFRVAS